jgi:CRISPR/Cas system-associated exonuclease Cas4 (RecB family)
MSQFLKLVAEDIYQRFSENIENVTVVFPSRRPEFYFYRYLSQIPQKEILAPKVMTLNELVGTWSELTLVSNLELIYRIYTIYEKHVGKTETFDQFYFWGELILSDFDEIDRSLADPAKVFALITQVKQIEEVFADEELAKIVGRFWETVYAGNETEIRKRFLNFWKALLPLYLDFNRHLSENGIAYQGKMAKTVLEGLKEGKIQISGSHYLFVGFDYLSNAEKSILSHLKSNGKALFYWDYDESFLDNKFEAGRFIREYLELFPSSLTASHFKNFQEKKNVAVLEVPGLSAVAQVSVNQSIGNQSPKNYEPDVTALVLADENLLLPTLSALPEIDNVNITLGWPVKYSNPATFIHHLLEIWTTSVKSGDSIKFSAKSLQKLGEHGWMSRNDSTFIAEQTFGKIYVDGTLFKNQENLHNLLFLDKEIIVRQLVRIVLKYIQHNNPANPPKSHQATIDEESAHHILLHFNQFANVVSRFGLKLELSTQIKLINKLLNSITVPFEGSPLSGIQITSLRETRCLDFRNVIIAGANEGIMPAGQNRLSHIPHSIRKAFGLSTVEDDINREAYYLYRLMERAQEISFVVNTDEQEMDKPEISRFVQQIVVEQKWNFAPPKSFGYQISTKFPKPISYPWNEMVQQYMLRFLDGGKQGLSPSAINTYIDCPLKFYFKFPCNLTEPQIDTEVMDSRIFGNLLHKTIEQLYAGYIGKIVEKHDFERIHKSKIVDQIVEEVAAEMHEINNQSGYNMLYKGIISEYVQHIVSVDMQTAPIHFIGLEQRVFGDITVATPQGEKKIFLKGTIDRVDRLGETVRVLDYKTGNPEVSVDQNLENVFDNTATSRKKEALQAILYATLWHDMNPGTELDNITTGLIISRKVMSEGFSLFRQSKSSNPCMTLADVSDVFEQNLKNVLSNMFDETAHFAQTDNESMCRFCSYTQICQR